MTEGGEPSRVESRPKVCGNPAGQNRAETGGGAATASLQLVVRTNEPKGTAVTLTLKLGHK